MSKKVDKRFILTDESVNRYGFRILTGGISNLEQWKKNPIMLYMHLRNEGYKGYGSDPIGHWEDIEITDKGEITAVPVFDLVTETSKRACAMVEEDTIRSCSIGFRAIEVSDDPSVLLPGQRRATVTKWDMMEASIVDIPANGNAVRLFDENYTQLAVGDFDGEIPIINPNHNKPMKLKANFKAIIGLLFPSTKSEDVEELSISEEDLGKIDEEMSRLRAELDKLTNEKTQLTSDHAAVLAAKDAEIAKINQQLAASTSETTQHKAEIAQLTAQVEALKKGPADGEEINPKNEPDSTHSDPHQEFLAYCEKNPDDTIGQMKKMQELGLA